MNKKTIIIAILAVAAAVGFMAWGYGGAGAGPAGTESGGQSSLTASETVYDFGAISMAKGKVDHVFQIGNPTDKDVAIRDVQTSCMCTAAYIVNGSSREGPFGMPGMGGMTAANGIVPAHGTVAIDVVYDPAAHGPAGVGAIDRFVRATEANGAILQLEIKAAVIP